MPPPRPRSALPSRAERLGASQQHQQRHDPTVVSGSNQSSLKALQRARQAGHLKLQARGLTSLPDEVWDIATVDLPDNTNWWETRETLETIDATQNEIASLPDHFANKLDQLREFNLNHNKLTSLPPAQSWCALEALVNLALGHNELRTLPEHFGHGNLPPLVRLSAEHNRLQALPSSLGSLCDLVELDLSHNQLTQLPPGLHGLASLQRLLLGHNKLVELPADVLASPPPLLQLDLTENRLQSLALNVPSVQTLQLGNNSLHALDLNGCESLQELSAPFNTFAALPGGLPSLPLLATVDLSNNRIVSIDELARCLALTRLDLSCNEISVVPPLMGNLPLNRLALSANPLRTLPNHIREAPTPKLLAHLRGKIVDAAPQWEGDTRGAMANLLDISDADAGSTAHSAVPPPSTRGASGNNELWRFVMREGSDLVVPGMGLSALPTRGYPESLTRIDASGNALRALPEALGRLVPSLRVLDVTKNGMLTHLPADLGEACGELETLKASHNGLTSLSSLLKTPLLRLMELHADRNGLSDVPPCLWHCPRLKHVSLCANKFHNLSALAMPRATEEEGGGGAKDVLAPLEHLDLGENRLGALPPLGLYPRLREVHVQQNGIRELPVPEITPLMQLQTFDISMNDVSTLPPDLARLPLLQNLTIVGNPIRSIPQSVQQRGATAVIDLLRKRLPVEAA